MTNNRSLRLGFKTSVITLFVAIVLVIGLALVYLSFERITAVTNAAASQFIGKVAESSADRIGSQLKLVRDNLEILNALPPIQSAEIEDNPRLYALLAAMVRNNTQLFSLYVGYDDGSFIEMDDIGGTGRDSRARLEAPEQAAFRLVVISRSDPARVKSRRLFLSETLEIIRELPGPLDYDPRQRPWYKDAERRDGSWLTGPYIFFATGKQGYTVQSALKAGRGGVIAGDLLMDATQEVLKREKLSDSGVAFLFDDDDRILAHPRMSEMLGREVSGTVPSLRETDMAGVLKAIRAWRANGISEQFFNDPAGRLYAAAFQTIPRSGPANLRVAVVAPVDEFFASILSERRRLFVATLGFVAAMVPIVFVIGSILSKSLRALADETDRIQRFQPAVGSSLHSTIREIDDLGRSVSTMRTLVQTFSNFVPKRLVQQLVETGDAMTLGGARREVTVLFTDVVNFTGLTENRDPTQVMQYTSRYFGAMSEAIMANEGTVDKFIGDAVMGIWNAPIEDDDHVANACVAVLACIEANGELNAAFQREGWPLYNTRFGLHVGDAVVGNIGSLDRMNYTVLGATVNLAARLEGLNKNYGTSILVSSAIKQRVDGRFHFRSVDRINPKGFAEAFEIYELRSERADVPSADAEFCLEWEMVYVALRNGPLVTAEELLGAFLAKYPWDGIAGYHRRLSARAG
ncbi:adenylate/guanylate cyclase domain-containing protein [Bradyrhizobium sp. AUGA SZCCT0177]|uniref:adenylate/guanylate cyclase domain-containing protein n=1 Tax=Bradyrhizobium sp. AUGA SZCCT0177 TaxID=2807665 RepID=UPI001BA4E688|nr:adenylate/guanylate cyclase domain-containing protein [Bradyrhizobium sp. AUGA SZCCT0177]MBR1286075.1 adenylate/guanylate cyclase domain-containing protein [Bradyrhizobium sp. AUGA SZCCT0177]